MFSRRSPCLLLPSELTILAAHCFVRMKDPISDGLVGPSPACVFPTFRSARGPTFPLAAESAIAASLTAPSALPAQHPSCHQPRAVETAPSTQSPSRAKSNGEPLATECLASSRTWPKHTARAEGATAEGARGGGADGGVTAPPAIHGENPGGPSPRTKVRSRRTLLRHQTLPCVCGGGGRRNTTRGPARASEARLSARLPA